MSWHRAATIASRPQRHACSQEPLPGSRASLRRWEWPWQSVTGENQSGGKNATVPRGWESAGQRGTDGAGLAGTVLPAVCCWWGQPRSRGRPGAGTEHGFSTARVDESC